MAHHKNLYLLHSLIAPYYTIYAVDTIWRKEQGMPHPKRFADRYTIDAIGEYQPLFQNIRQLMNKQFPKIQFVPVIHLKQTLTGLDLPFLKGKRRVYFFQALFGKHLFPLEIRPSLDLLAR